MARVSRQTKEVIKTVLFFLVLAGLLVVYVIYPLGTVGSLAGRENLSDYSPDSSAANSLGLFASDSLVADTFWVEADGLTDLAALYLPPAVETPPAADSTSVTDSLPAIEAPRGTAILLHADRAQRDSLKTVADSLRRSGFAVVLYDQRASGRSTGKYRGDGYYESDDLESVIAHLAIRDRLDQPLFVIGWQLGGDAALLTEAADQRIARVVAIEPYLSTARLLDIQRERAGVYWFPLYRTIMAWWYDIRSGYAAPYRTIDDIAPVSVPTLLLADQVTLESDELARLVELSDPNLLVTALAADTASANLREILEFVRR